MTPAERTEFIAELRTTAGLFGRRLDEGMGMLYAKTLDDLPLARLLLALEQLVREADQTRRFPMPRELRDLALGIRRPTTRLSDDDQAPITQQTYTRMAAWEREQHAASAWPAFRHAWLAAAGVAGITGDVTVALHTAWHRWLEAGSPLTQDAKTRILRDVLPRIRPGSVFATVISDIAACATARDREPGEEG